MIFAPAIGGAGLISLASILMMLIGGNVFLWFAGLTALVNAVALAFWRRRSAHKNPHAMIYGILAAVGTLTSIFGLRARMLSWDARSIWLLHARWFWAGHRYLALVIGHRGWGFAHPDYPPLVPATAAASWTMFGEIDYRQAELIIAILNASAVALAVCGLIEIAAGRWKRFALLPGALLASASFGLAGVWGIDGNADLLWAACAVAALLYGLITPRSRGHFAIAMIASVGAMLTKQEGFIVGSLVAFSSMLRYGRAYALPAAITFAAGASWQFAIRVMGGGGETTSLIGGHVKWFRLPAILRACVHYVGPIAAGAAVCGIIGWIFLRKERRELDLGSQLWPWAAAGVSLAVVTRFWLVVVLPGTFASRFPRPSISRYFIFAQVVLLADMATWVIVALHTLWSRQRVADPLIIEPKPTAGP